MKQETSPITVHILGKEYKIACTENERDNLITSAQQLDEQMREIKNTGKVIGSDRIAVMAALNLAHELGQMQSKNTSVSQELADHLANLRRKIQNVLESV